jgi:hypothetical protein
MFVTYRFAPQNSRLATNALLVRNIASIVTRQGNAMPISLVLNRRKVTLDVAPDVPLLWAIREGCEYEQGTKLTNRRSAARPPLRPVRSSV